MYITVSAFVSFISLYWHYNYSECNIIVIDVCSVWYSPTPYLGIYMCDS